MANELTLVGITDMWKKFGKPPVANKERVWLAVDHTVDPRIYTEPKPTALMKLSEDFAAETGITDYWKPNTTIMHTGASDIPTIKGCISAHTIVCYPAVDISLYYVLSVTPLCRVCPPARAAGPDRCRRRQPHLQCRRHGRFCVRSGRR